MTGDSGRHFTATPQPRCLIPQQLRLIILHDVMSKDANVAHISFCRRSIIITSIIYRGYDSVRQKSPEMSEVYVAFVSRVAAFSCESSDLQKMHGLLFLIVHRMQPRPRHVRYVACLVHVH